MRLDAPAKVNLYLHVVGRRADGFHLLDSLVAFVGTGDTVEVRPAAALGLVVEGPAAGELTAGADNLVLRAARLLAGEAGVAEGADIRLIKRLPVAAGIGGGSADAAATLRALARLWNLPPDAGRLAALAARLGADVPVCLHGRPAFVGGIGEELAPAPTLPPAGLVLVNPRVALATPAVFGARRGAFSPPGRFAGPLPDAAALAAALAARRNDLTDPARRLCPAVDEVLSALEGMPEVLLARMSGSGATCFGLTADRSAASRVAGRLAAARPDWWVVATGFAEPAEGT